jgi:hypothetical protein
LRLPPFGWIIDAMEQTSSRYRAGRPRVLLIGMTARMLALLEGPLGDAATVTCSPFPSPHFDRLVDDVRPHLAVVDVTYLEEASVRPALMTQLAPHATVLVFTTPTGYGWVDDPRRRRSDYLDDVTPEALLALVAVPQLRAVTPQV